MLPLTIGFFIAGPVSGYLSDRYGARYFSTGGMSIGALSFGLLMGMPANFNYIVFSVLLLIMGIGSGLFAAPNTTAIMNSVPAHERGQASGMRATFINSGQVLSIGLFFSLMILGLARTLPQAMASSLVKEGVSPAVAQQVAATPPVSSLFAAFLGYNPMQQLVPKSVLDALSAKNAALITGKEFFPQLISAPFMDGLRIAFTLSFIAYLLAALASWLRGKKYVHGQNENASGRAY
jgi:MFS family permease